MADQEEDCASCEGYDADYTESEESSESSEEEEESYKNEESHKTNCRKIYNSKKPNNLYDDKRWASSILDETHRKQPNPNSSLRQHNQEFPHSKLQAKKKVNPQKGQQMDYFCTGCNKTIQLRIGDDVPCKNSNHKIYRLTDYNKMVKYQKKGLKVHSSRFRTHYQKGEMVITCDGSFKQNLSVCSSFKRDDNLDFVDFCGIASYKTCLYNSNDTETEALNLAIETGCQIQEVTKASGMPCNIIHIMSDSKLNVQAYNEGVLQNPHHKGRVDLELINQCRVKAGLQEWPKEMKKREAQCATNPNLLVTHIPRELNQLAHLAAIRNKEGDFKMTQMTEKMQRISYEEKFGLYSIRVPKKPKQKTLQELEAEKEKEVDQKQQSVLCSSQVPAEPDRAMIIYQKEKADQKNYTFKYTTEKAEVTEKVQPKVPSNTKKTGRPRFMKKMWVPKKIDS